MAIALLRLLQTSATQERLLEGMLRVICSTLDIKSGVIHVQSNGQPAWHVAYGEPESAIGELLMACLTQCVNGEGTDCLASLKHERTENGSLWWSSLDHLKEMARRPNSPGCVQRLAEALQSESLCITPLYCTERFCGSLVAHDHRSGQINADIVATIETYTPYLGVAMELGRTRDHLNLLVQAVQQSAESIIITDESGIIQYVNTTFEQTTGYRASEVIGQNPRILQSGKQPTSYYEEMWDSLLRGEVWQGLFVNRRKDGTEFDEKVIIFPVRNSQGRITNFVANKRDVTRENSLESQLRQAQKMEGIGRLAGGIAHDFNNLLTSILGFSRLSMEMLPEDHPVRSDLQEVVASAERATRLTRQLLAFSRKQLFEIGPMDLNQTLLQMEQLLRRSVGEEIALSMELEEDLPAILADQGGIEQIVLNLTVNARDAMPDGGTIRVSTRLVQTAPPSSDLSATHDEPLQSYVCITVEDTGSGIDPKMQSQIFEPFFTTKEKSKGTGLGLAMVHGMVNQFRGLIELESELGVGTCMRILIPVSHQSASNKRQVNESDIEGGNEKLLVVEDDPSLRRLNLRMLPRLGYTVEVAANGREALRILEQRKGQFDLIFTDLVMPEMGGLELIEHVRPAYPHIKVLFTTGFSQESLTRQNQKSNLGPVLLKPFTLEQVARRIREALRA